MVTTATRTDGDDGDEDRDDGDEDRRRGQATRTGDEDRRRGQATRTGDEDRRQAANTGDKLHAQSMRNSWMYLSRLSYWITQQ
jgi:hypothetical protein